MVVKVPLFHEVSIFIILKALGLVKDKEVVDYITYNSNDNEMIKLLEIIINISKNEGDTQILSQDDALNYLIQKVKVSIKYNDLIKESKENEYLVKKEHLKMLLIKSFIPHINNFEYNDILKAKGIYVCYMINKLLNCYLGRTELDDRDSFLNKRVSMPGDTILDIAIKNHKKMLNNTNKSYKKRMQTSNENVNVINTIETKPVLSSLKKALSNGVTDAILYSGTRRYTDRMAAALKGVIDAGVKVPADEEAFPADERISGEHLKVKNDVASVKSKIDGEVKTK